MVSSMKIHCVTVAVLISLVGSIVLPCNASTTVDEPAKYNHPTALRPVVSPPPPPPAAHHSPPPPPPVRPVIVVEGVIYCKSCKLRGYNRNMDASPLRNATASLVCYGGEASKYRVLNLTSTATSKEGYFMVMVYDVDMFDVRSCRVYLRSSPTPLCAAPFVPANVKLGLTLVKEPAGRAPLPKGARGAYHPETALMYKPAAGGKCPPY